MNPNRLFKLVAALALVMAVVLLVSLATASQPDQAPVSGSQGARIEGLAPDSVYARWVAHAQKLWNAQRGERQLPDNRTCVLLCGGR